jgi:PIN domain nuclease of toxin-antitoxin system
MRILLDSHALICWMDDPSRLKPVARAAISDPANEVFASSVSIWELGLKAAKAKLRLPQGFENSLWNDGIQPLSFTPAHAVQSIGLPSIHGDPFDRALVAQCIAESLTLATRDHVLGEYGVSLLVV